MKEKLFHKFKTPTSKMDIPTVLNDPFSAEVPNICKLAAKELTSFLNENKSNLEHDFGFDSESTTYSKGKMFGVLVVKSSKNELGYLCAYSGKLNGNQFPEIFVPSVFDLFGEEQFLSEGMMGLSEIGKQIDRLIQEKEANEEIEILRNQRKNKSIQLQKKLFEHYVFSNKEREEKSLIDIFQDYANRKPASGAGECAGPKLLQFAFENEMEALGLAEFWWGKTGFTKGREQGQFYPACEEKCRPILSFMLNLEE